MTSMHESETQPRLVVGVGASAGGLEAFKQLLAALPDDSGMAFILVQHLDPNHESMLPELLARCTGMKIRSADEGARVRANTVYVIRPDTSVAVSGGRIALSEPKVTRGVRLPVDHLFRSLAQDYAARSVGIVLSGAGSDGSAGLKVIKAAGGLTIAQEPSASGQPGMPKSAIDTGIIDLVLEIDDMPAALERFAALPPDAREEPSTAAEPADAADPPVGPLRLDHAQFSRLATILETRLDFDLRVYKRATVERRVLRRMTLSAFDDADSYIECVRSDGTERQLLVRDMLISVTDFFRDPEAFSALRHEVIEPLVTETRSGETLRAWVPGCATGEEAYSIAMEFLDAIDAQGKRLSLQLFATDVDRDALAVGRTAVYAPSIAEHVSEERLRKHFKPLDGRGYQVRQQLRDVVSFAVHDLTKDPPFSKMDLVSCRNVLIYLAPETQRHVLHVLHFALRPERYLFLSTSESASAQGELFSTVSKRYRIYKKRGASRPVPFPRARQKPETAHDDPNAAAHATAPDSTQASEAARKDVPDLARRTVLEAWVPPTVVVSEDGRILFMHGELSPYLRFPQGDDPKLELASLVRPQIATRATSALYRCRRHQEPVVAFSSPEAGAHPQVRITAKPAPALGEAAVMLTFERMEDRPSSNEEHPAPHGDEAVIEQLEKELHATREDLRNTVEELETSNEELRSSNEESMSTNEELQSANEELEATTEELRSLNEELTTVNSQLREKIEQLEQARDDLHNFFASAKIATIFLDEGLRIKRFTPAARELLHIDYADHGRHLGNIARELLEHGLETEARAVLDHLTPRSSELRTKDGRWFTRQVLPYQTESRRIEGVVVTFVDVTELKAATERLERRRQQQAVIARVGLHALNDRDIQGFMEQVVRDVQQTLSSDFCTILELQPGKESLCLRAGVGWAADTVGTASVHAGLDSQAGYTLQADEPVIVDDLETEQRFSGPALLTNHQVHSGLSSIIRDGDQRYGVIGVHGRARGQFNAEDAQFLQTVGTVVGSAVGRWLTRVRAAIERGVLRVISEAWAWHEAVDQVFACFARELGTTVAQLWTPDAHGALHCERTYAQRTEIGSAELAASAPEREPWIVERLRDQRRACWFTDRGLPTWPRPGESLSDLGLTSGFAVPVVAGSDFLGALMLYSPDRLIADEALLRSFEVLGRALGDYYVRLDFEQRTAHLAAITESAHDAIWSYDADGRISDWLSGAERLFGYAREEIVGRSIEQLVPDERLEEFWNVTSRIRDGEVLGPFATRRRCKDGRIVDVSVRCSAIHGRDGSITGVASTDRDITAEKDAERKLIEADRQKDEFLAMLGHELRNPLAAIQSTSELLKASCDGDEKLSRMQGILHRQTRHMAKLLDGLLDVSRIIRGKVELDTQPVDLAEVCRETVSDLESRVGQRKLELRVEVPPEPLWVEGDLVRLRQIVDNLLSNAVKYTPDGGSIVLRLTERGDRAEIRVDDTGVGIDPELLPFIFDVFRQSEQSMDRAQGGLGLGLALVRSLTELHQGTVEATSGGADTGASFRVMLPRTDGGGSPWRGQPAGPSGAKRIVLIEDNAELAEMLRQLLEISGHEVLVAGGGREGLRLVKRSQPDVVLCDLGLPDGVSGFDVARDLRADPETRTLPVVALTGYGRSEDKQAGMEAGFDAHLTKPVEADTLDRLLARLERSRRHDT